MLFEKFTPIKEGSAMQGVQWMKVKLLPHDDKWHEEFERTKQLICRVWGDAVVDVQHVGSTSIRSISAKPILDVAVVLRSFADMDVEALKNEGYRYMGARTESGDRQLFIMYTTRDGVEDVALEHIHCYEPGNADFSALVGFRDYLNAHPEAAREYDEIKRRLAEVHPDDRFAYSEGKRRFIERINAEVLRNGVD